MDDFPSDPITPREAARLVRCHISTIFRWLLKGKIRSWRRAGTRYLVSRAEVLALVERVGVDQPVRVRPGVASSGHLRAMEYLRTQGFKV